MIERVKAIVFPDGESQEIRHRLNINDIVDINGLPLHPPLPTVKMIAYRVYKISTKHTRNEEILQFHLDLLRRNEMEALV
jgi:hypothetical protein